MVSASEKVVSEQPGEAGFATRRDATIRVENFRHEGRHCFVQQTRMFISGIAARQRKKATR